MLDKVNPETKNSMILGIALLSFIISELTIFTLSGGTNIILAHLLYFPIILGAFRYPGKGIIISLVIGLSYFAVAGLNVPDILQLIPVWTQFYVYVSVGVVVSSLSRNMKVSEMRYKTIFENSGTGICLLDAKNGTIIRQNQRCADVLGDAIFENRSTHSNYGLWQNQEGVKEFSRRVMESGTIEGEERHLPTTGGQGTDLLLSASHLGDSEVLVNITDITAQKEAERMLREREELFHSLLDNMLDASIILDQYGTIVFANPAAALLGDLPLPEDLVGKPLRNFIQDEQYQSVLGDLANVQQDRGGYTVTYEITTASGEQRWVEGLGAKILYKQSPAAIVTVRDITPRKDEERKIEIQRDLGHALASTSSIKEASRLCVNAAIKAAGIDCGGLYLLDKASGDLVLAYALNVPSDFTMDVSQFTPDSDFTRQVCRGIPMYVNRTDIPSLFDNCVVNEGLKSIAVIPFMSRGELLGCFNIASHEVEEIPFESRAALEAIGTQVGNAFARIFAESSINESQVNLQALFDSMDDLIFVADVKGGILHTNPVVETRLGYTGKELLTMNLLDVHPPWARDEAMAVVANMINGSQDTCHLPLLTKCGEEIPVETKIAFGLWGKEKALFGITRDITERKRHEDALRRRDIILDAVSYAAGKFLHDTAWEDHIPEVLRHLGEATGASRVYLFENHVSPVSGDLLCSYRNEWCNGGIEPHVQDSMLHDVSYFKDFPRWHDTLSAGKCLFGNLKDFPDAERAYLEPQGIESLVVVPVFVDGEWWGFLGFDDCLGERHWSQTEIDALSAAANIIGLAIHRAMMDEVFRKPVENSLVGTYLLQEGTIHYINPRGAELFDYPREELMDAPYAPLIHPEDLPMMEDLIYQRISGGIDSANYEFRGITRTGDEIILEAYGTALSYKGKPAVIGTIMDITARKKAEKALVTGKERLELALKGADLGLFDWYVDTGKIVVNDRWAGMLGYGVDEIDPHISSWERLIHPDEVERVRALLQSHLNGRIPAYFGEYRLLAKSGEWKWVLAQGKVVSRDAAGRPLRMTGTHLDITDRKKAEQRIDHLNRVILAVRNVNELIIRVKDREELIRQACRNLIETRGYHSAWIALFDDDGSLQLSAEAGIGEQFGVLVDQMGRGEVTRCTRAALECSGITAIHHPKLSCADSPIAYHYEDFGLLSIRLEHEGDVYGLLNISLPRDLVDDEEEKALFREVAGDLSFSLHSIALEEERGEAEKELRIKDAAVASSINGMAIIDLDGYLTYVNDSFLNLCGYASGDGVIGRPVTDFIFREAESIGFLDAVYDQGWYVGEIAVLKEDGTTFDGLTHASLVIDDQNGPICFMISVVDVTETRRAQEALRTSEEKYRSIFDNAQIGILVVQDEEVKYVNPYLVRSANMAKRSIFDAIHPEDAAEVVDNYRRHIAGEVVPTVLPFRMLAEDGSVRWMELHSFLFSWDWRPAVLYFLIDINERMIYEEQMKASLEEKSVLLMEVHHRVKNNLQIVTGLIKLQSRSIQDELAVRSLKACENRILTMSLVHESLYLSDNLAQINAREHFERLASNLLRSGTESSSIHLVMDVDEIPLNLDIAIHCSLIINELLTNSMKYAFAGRDGGTITVSLQRNDDGLCRLSVADDGVGLPEGFDIDAVRSLGLKMVMRLAKGQLGGTLDIKGDHGTSFVITFPEKKKS